MVIVDALDCIMNSEPDLGYGQVEQFSLVGLFMSVEDITHSYLYNYYLLVLILLTGLSITQCTDIQYIYIISVITLPGYLYQNHLLFKISNVLRLLNAYIIICNFASRKQLFVFYFKLQTSIIPVVTIMFYFHIANLEYLRYNILYNIADVFRTQSVVITINVHHVYMSIILASTLSSTFGTDLLCVHPRVTLILYSQVYLLLYNIYNNITKNFKGDWNYE